MIFRVGLYLGIGAMFHLLFVGSIFNWQSVLTWLWLFAWPLMLLMWMGAAAVVIGMLCLAGLGAAKLVRG